MSTTPDTSNPALPLVQPVAKVTTVLWLIEEERFELWGKPDQDGWARVYGSFDDPHQADALFWHLYEHARQCQLDKAEAATAECLGWVYQDNEYRHVHKWVCPEHGVEDYPVWEDRAPGCVGDGRVN